MPWTKPDDYTCHCQDFDSGKVRTWLVEYPDGREYHAQARCEHEAKTLANLRYLPGKRLKARVVG